MSTTIADLEGQHKARRERRAAISVLISAGQERTLT